MASGPRAKVRCQLLPPAIGHGYQSGSDSRSASALTTGDLCSSQRCAQRQTGAGTLCRGRRPALRLVMCAISCRVTGLGASWKGCRTILGRHQRVPVGRTVGFLEFSCASTASAGDATRSAPCLRLRPLWTTHPPGLLGPILLCACDCIDATSSALTILQPFFESGSRVLCYPVAAAMLALSVSFLWGMLEIRQRPACSFPGLWNCYRNLTSTSADLSSGLGGRK
ncbi:hypothetical protein C8Q78DRAFT_891 [Trametes maxima]|nr:hypothetical protein C8Q78DRAFT_891 [Trametes maxima]